MTLMWYMDGDANLREKILFSEIKYLENKVVIARGAVNHTNFVHELFFLYIHTKFVHEHVYGNMEL